MIGCVFEMPFYVIYEDSIERCNTKEELIRHLDGAHAGDDTENFRSDYRVIYSKEPIYEVRDIYGWGGLESLEISEEEI